MSTEKNSKGPSGSKNAKANRQNSMKSTGPKTSKGKRKVSQNALKHGVFARDVVIGAGDGKESMAEFKRLLETFRQDLKPVGALEEALVEQIVQLLWRLRRVLRCETGEIRSKLDDARSQEINRQTEKIQSKLQSAYNTKHMAAFKCSSSGVRYLLNILDEAEGELKQTGLISGEVLHRLKSFFGDSEIDLPGLCASYDPSGCPEEENGIFTADRGHLYEAIDWEREYLEELLKSLEKSEAMALEAKILSLHLPDRETIEKLLRYESAITKQLDRAIILLHALQKRREK
ncbi:MAG: hypothetical protein KAT30_02015 [Candidatus Krumholzibacteria bacterium]|nr:hypothetical protein [Candidatus Krumholzibacteria bacterium]